MKPLLKYRLFLLGTLFVLVLCYFLAFSKTFSLKSQINEFVLVQERSKEIPKEIMLLSRKQQYLDSILGAHDLANTSLENSLLNQLNANAPQYAIKVISFNKPHRFENEVAQTTTYRFTIEGGFTNILNTLYQLERQNIFGEVTHVDFEKQERARSSKKWLSATVHLRNYN